jgi:ATP-dependent exoDNAse (exonuclease V) alpha subunit
MTYNKAQGQTMSKVLLDITKPPFAHGHLYVALSRIQFYRDIKLFCSEEQLDDSGSPLVTNVVHSDLLFT